MTRTGNERLSLATIRNPFNDSLIASGADDGKVMSLPELELIG
jgi:hypothetical protein